MVYRSRKGRTAALDFREKAPASSARTPCRGPGLHTDFTGHLTVGVPGTVAGMSAALRRFGTLSLANAIAPAVRLARQGVRVRPGVSEAIAENADRLKMFPASAKQFLKDGTTPYPAGSLLRQPDLARTPRGDRQERPTRLLPRPHRAPDRRRDGPHAAEPDGGGRRRDDPRRTSPSTAPSGAGRSGAPTAATASSRCRRRPPAAWPSSRCSTCSRATTCAPPATRRPTRCT